MPIYIVVDEDNRVVFAYDTKADAEEHIKNNTELRIVTCPFRYHVRIPEIPLEAL